MATTSNHCIEFSLHQRPMALIHMTKTSPATFLILSLIILTSQWLPATAFEHRSNTYLDLVKTILDGINLYKVLNLKQEDVTLSEIKRAYRMVSMKYHPDLDNSKEGLEIYLKIQFAFEVLSDSTKKEEYDRLLKEGIPAYDKYFVQYSRGTSRKTLNPLWVSLIILIFVTAVVHFIQWKRYLSLGSSRQPPAITDGNPLSCSQALSKKAKKQPSKKTLQSSDSQEDTTIVHRKNKSREAADAFNLEQPAYNRPSIFDLLPILLIIKLGQLMKWYLRVIWNKLSSYCLKRQSDQSIKSLNTMDQKDNRKTLKQKKNGLSHGNKI